MAWQPPCCLHPHPPPQATNPNPQVLGALREVAAALGMAVRPYSVTPGAAFPSFVASMAHTGVLVARHGPLLANSLFLPPGALVLELLPYNWEWRGISEVYLNLTRSTGHLHHFAWKANSSEVRYCCSACTVRSGSVRDQSVCGGCYAAFLLNGTHHSLS